MRSMVGVSHEELPLSARRGQYGLDLPVDLRGCESEEVVRSWIH